jgi:hypothetical protein
VIGVVITQRASHPYVLCEAEKIVFDVVHLKDISVAPEVFSIIKQVALVLGNDNGNSFGNGASVALALVAMVMRMKNRLNLAHADLAEQVQDVSGAEVN